MGPDANGQILDELYPARRLLNLIADKWTPIVMYCLASGSRRFDSRSIQENANSGAAQVGARWFSPSRGLPGCSPKTEYTLTDLGRRLHEPM
jgi:DNA-binding HxlR family transcriptional regulator